MNGKQAKRLRKEATGNSSELQVQYYVEKDKDGQTKQSLVPLPAQYDEGSSRWQYKLLKKKYKDSSLNQLLN